jgi:hypothetical protein
MFWLTAKANAEVAHIASRVGARGWPGVLKAT